ncbi:MAG: hypothetical protein NWF03_02760 [Candidatus Bathyarchaeota archaeon]|nr:hypothetical protein [Candidatus Bathyarchaeota archaeon]
MSNNKQKNELKAQLELMEKEILNLTGKEQARARIEYQELLKLYREKCGNEESIYLVRA